MMRQYLDSTVEEVVKEGCQRAAIVLGIGGLSVVGCRWAGKHTILFSFVAMGGGSIFLRARLAFRRRSQIMGLRARSNTRDQEVEERWIGQAPLIMACQLAMLAIVPPALDIVGRGRRQQMTEELASQRMMTMSWAATFTTISACTSLLDSGETGGTVHFCGELATLFGTGAMLFECWRWKLDAEGTPAPLRAVQDLLAPYVSAVALQTRDTLSTARALLVRP